ncbi:AbrB/MazE/SpoVT family DNA-binding domain-containing protein [Moorella sp. Hama-1]|uniref:AbrB/MazE/SpoVT family DNA-binding domain-containing protein n=1 Tax=Moorella sp. Hama-1 TaxID=2138101 RepID=UPI001F16E7DD|nr:AbrB/MazE/SpoVT family DNA-binding domain-containing protein [Moorella sp. Hama-1]
MLISIGQLARKLGLKEGDYVRLELAEDSNSLRLVPVDWHPRQQEYFWSEEWQERMQKSLQDLAEERVKSYGDVEELIGELEHASDNKD